MEILNLTPHEVTVRDPETGKDIMVFPPSGKVARVSYSTPQVIGTTPEGAPITYSYPQELKDIPAPKPGVFLIVSGQVLSALPNRKDLLVPDTFRAFRDEAGHIVAVPSLRASSPDALE